MILGILAAIFFSFLVFTEQGRLGFSLYLILVIVVCWQSFKPFSQGIRFTNRIVTEITVSDERITGHTADFTLLLGLIKKSQITFEISKAGTDIYESPIQKESTQLIFGRLYTIDVATDKYYVGENFFDDFVNLKRSLETFIGHPLEEKIEASPS